MVELDGVEPLVADGEEIRTPPHFRIAHPSALVLDRRLPQVGGIAGPCDHIAMRAEMHTGMLEVAAEDEITGGFEFGVDVHQHMLPAARDAHGARLRNEQRAAFVILLRRVPIDLDGDLPPVVARENACNPFHPHLLTPPQVPEIVVAEIGADLVPSDEDPAMVGKSPGFLALGIDARVGEQLALRPVNMKIGFDLALAMNEARHRRVAHRDRDGAARAVRIFSGSNQPAPRAGLRRPLLAFRLRAQCMRRGANAQRHAEDAEGPDACVAGSAGVDVAWGHHDWKKDT